MFEPLLCVVLSGYRAKILEALVPISVNTVTYSADWVSISFREKIPPPGQRPIRAGGLTPFHKGGILLFSFHKRENAFHPFYKGRMILPPFIKGFFSSLS
jgi:hypothetical protein